MDNHIVSTVFGTLSAVFWSIQLLPQIFLNYRRHDTEGLSPTFMLLWIAAGVPLGVYNIANDLSIALQIQPVILTALSLITWIQCRHYGTKWPARKIIACAGGMALGLGGVEAGLVFAVRRAIDRGLSWPSTLMAVLAGLLLVLGVCEQYVAIFKSKSIEGISFLFCALDAAGDITAIVSIIYEADLDATGIAIYSSEFVAWCGIFAIGAYFRFFLGSRSKRVQETATPSDAAHETSEGVQLHDLPSSTSVFSTGISTGISPGLDRPAIRIEAPIVQVGA